MSAPSLVDDFYTPLSARGSWPIGFRRGLKKWLPRHKCHGLAYFEVSPTTDNHKNMPQTTAIADILTIRRAIGMESALVFSGDANSGPAGKNPQQSLAARNARLRPGVLSIKGPLWISMA